MLNEISKKEGVGRADLYTLEKTLVKVSKSPSPNAKFTKSDTRVMKLGYTSFTRKDN